MIHQIGLAYPTLLFNCTILLTIYFNFYKLTALKEIIFEHYITEEIIMISIIDNFLEHSYKALIFWGSGWKRRKQMLRRRWVLQWRDPQTGLWYSEKTALRLLKVQALEQLDLN